MLIGLVNYWRQEAEDAKAQIARMNDEYEMLQSELGELQAIVDEVEDLEAEIDSLQQTVDKVRGDRNHLATQYQSAESRTEYYRRLYRGLRQNVIDALPEDVWTGDIVQSIDNLADLLDCEEERAEYYKDKYEELEKERETLNETNLRARVRWLQDALDTSTRRAEELAERVRLAEAKSAVNAESVKETWSYLREVHGVPPGKSLKEAVREILNHMDHRLFHVNQRAKRAEQRAEGRLATIREYQRLVKDMEDVLRQADPSVDADTPPLELAKAVLERVKRLEVASRGSLGYTFAEYQRAAERTAKQYDDVETAIMAFTLGLSGEAGEVAELIKKWVRDEKDFPAYEVQDEMGDLLWYIANLSRLACLSLGSVAVRNVEKLKERYPEGFEVCQS